MNFTEHKERVDAAMVEIDVLQDKLKHYSHCMNATQVLLAKVRVKQKQIVMEAMRKRLREAIKLK